MEKSFCFLYCLQAFSTKKILKNINDFFKINGIQIPKEGEHVTFKNYEKKNKKISIYDSC